MLALFPIAAAFLQTGSFVLDKIILSARGMDYRSYAGVSFLSIFVINIFIFFIFRPALSMGQIASIGLILVLSAGLGIVRNLLFYKALKTDGLGEIEMFDLLRYIPIIIFSSLIFADERNFGIVIPALIASVAVIWSHWEHHHVQMARNTAVFFWWSFILAPLMAALTKILLQTLDPISLEVLRSGIMAVFLVPIFYKKAEKIPNKVMPTIWLTNFLTTAAWVLFYFGYQKLGIVYTMLLFSLQPLLVYFSSVLLLKEKFIPKRAVAFAIVLVSIVVAQVIK